MDDVVVLLELESLQNLYGKPPDEVLRHALEVVVLDEFVEIYAEAFEGNHQVLAEQNEVLDSDNIVLVVLVVEV